ncbi:tRNA (guanine(46)-N(7))-methyltransferase TrmB [Azospirillum griseum]|uniref:tRNA (guanine-N(7)-)-methyltransferase n=1 Tax=Azospirillum griseum TaxID=2496639 RepID=A0A431VLL3_9PROT|nr:tRNA (guanine(46)-N(7))-methyltransferase TrmB [Azospirillum griseum]RTR21907.1 tRNA (guanosine(46)-N7)-methyltransferase TrmB [Azospirillum griseum]
MTDPIQSADPTHPATSDDAESGGVKNRVYGRRKGRPLHKRKTGLLDTLLPTLSIPTPQRGDRLDPPGLFAVPVTDVWLEVGFGGGHHLARVAADNPSVGVIGAEPFINGVASLLALVEDAGLESRVRVLADDARPLIDALPDASIGRAFVLFADPWPKTRHHSRRFIGPENLARLSRVLKDGAELRVASDDMGLVRWSLEHLMKHPDFTWTARVPSDWRVRPADWPATRYEEKAIEAGRKPVFLRFLRNPR